MDKSEGNGGIDRDFKAPDEETKTSEAEQDKGFERVKAEFQKFIDAFERKHSLEELHAIVDLTIADAPSHPVREPARKDLRPIVDFLREAEERLPEEQYKELHAKYMVLSRAVGIFNKGKLVHDRLL